MRHEFLDEHVQKIKKFAEPLLDEHAVLVAIEHIFFASHEQLMHVLAVQSLAHTSLLNKIKIMFEQSTRTSTQADKKTVSTYVYSFSGQVIATGTKVVSLRPGDMIACLGFDGSVHGDLACISEYDAVRISDHTCRKQASVTGFALFAMHAVLRANLQIGQTICIVGFGSLGYLILQLAKLSGVSVIVVDVDPKKTAEAQTYGADHGYISTEKGWMEDLLCVTQRHGVDTTFVLDIHDQSLYLDDAISITASHGKIVLVGFDNVHINHAVIGKKDIDVAITTLEDACHHGELYRHYNTAVPLVKWRQRNAMQRIIRLIEKQSLSVDCLIKHHIQSHTVTQHSFDEYKIHMGMLISFPPISHVSMHETEAKTDTPIAKKSCIPASTTHFIPATRDLIHIGVIGADHFVKDTLMPIVSRMHNVSVRTIADVEQARAEHISGAYGAAKMCIMDDEIWQGDIIDAVIVASNNIFHAERTIHALEHYKAVFVREPLVTSFEQFNDFTAMLAKRIAVPLCLNYYRSYSPFMRKIKHAVQKRSTPLMIRYRVNTCTSSRCSEQENSTVGKIIGDACHFLDLFCYLTDAQPVAVSVEAIHTMRDDIFPTDNFTTQISFNDGSVCSLVYTSIGHEHFGGEHMEIFFDSKVIVMQDFLTLHGYGLPSWFDELLSVPDTGFKHLITHFLDSLREPHIQDCMLRDRIITVSHLALIIDQLACAGGGSKKYEQLSR